MGRVFCGRRVSVKASTRRVREATDRASGLSRRPNPGWSQAITRKPRAARSERLRVQTSAEEPSDAPCSKRTAGPLPSSRVRMRNPSTSMKFSFTAVRLLLRNVEQHAVGVGEVMSAVGAALEQREPRPPFRSCAHGEGTQMRIVVAHGLQALLHRLQVLHPEADVIRTGPRDSAALVVADAPGREDQGDAAVAEIVASVAGASG